MPTTPQGGAPFPASCEPVEFCGFGQSGALRSGLQGECIERARKWKAPPVWDAAFGPHPQEHVSTSALLSAFPDASTRRVKPSPAGGLRSCPCRKLLF